MQVSVGGGQDDGDKCVTAAGLPENRGHDGHQTERVS